jgi:uncharacterized protein (DUF302 family)
MKNETEDQGLFTMASNTGPKETGDRLAAAIAARGLTLFARIDHAAGAAAAGLPLRPTELFIFGNAKGGTVLMQNSQTAGIDLPLKALVWQDAAGATWISWNDLKFLAQRHRLGSAVDGNVETLATGLEALLQAVAQPA